MIETKKWYRLNGKILFLGVIKENKGEFAESPHNIRGLVIDNGVLDVFNEEVNDKELKEMTLLKELSVSEALSLLLSKFTLARNGFLFRLIRGHMYCFIPNVPEEGWGKVSVSHFNGFTIHEVPEAQNNIGEDKNGNG